MNITGNVTIDDIWELHNKKSRTSEEIKVYWDTRRENPELDRALYDYDKAQILKEITTEELMKRFILGYDLSGEEVDSINEEDPSLFEKSLEVKEEREILEEKILASNSQEECQNILSSAMVEAYEKGKEDETYLELKKTVILDLRDKYIDNNNSYSNKSEYSSMVNLKV